MSGHHPWSEIRRRLSRKRGKCDKLNIDGSVCGERKGMCIHDYTPTLFGMQVKERSERQK